jgi:hypothetical protein
MLNPANYLDEEAHKPVGGVENRHDVMALQVLPQLGILQPQQGV